MQSLTVQADDARADHDANLMASAVARQAAAASAARLSGIESRLKLCAKREEGRRAQAATPITAGSNDAEGWQPSADEGQEGPVPLSPPRLLASRSSVVVVVWASGFNCSGDATGHAMGAVRVSATGSGRVWVGGWAGWAVVGCRGTPVHRAAGGRLAGHAAGSWRTGSEVAVALGVTVGAVRGRRLPRVQQRRHSHTGAARRRRSRKSGTGERRPCRCLCTLSTF